MDTLSAPVWDPDRAAEAAGITLAEWDFDPGLLGLYVLDGGEAAIGLHRLLSRPEHRRLRRVVLAHELGHHANLHSGIQVASLLCGEDRLAHGRAEAQAERWAGEQLCPRVFVLDFLRRFGSIGTEEIAEMADVVDAPFDWITWWLSDLSTRQLVPGTRVNHPPTWQPRAGVLAELSDL